MAFDKSFAERLPQAKSQRHVQIRRHFAPR
jgi:hypothetical protein